jgi:hypothetical protein
LLWTSYVPFVIVVDPVTPPSVAVTVAFTWSAVKISEPVVPLHAVDVRLLMFVMSLVLFADPPAPRLPSV